MRECAFTQSRKCTVRLNFRIEREFLFFSRLYFCHFIHYRERYLSLFPFFFTFSSNIASSLKLTVVLIFSSMRERACFFIPFDISFFRDPSINCYRDATFLIF